MLTRLPSSMVRKAVPVGRLILSAAAILACSGHTAELPGATPDANANAAVSPAAKGTQITVLRASTPLVVAPPGSEINIQTNFDAKSPLSQEASLTLTLVGPHGVKAAQTDSNLNNPLTVLPTSHWSGPITLMFSMKLPGLAPGTYSILAELHTPNGPVQLHPGPGVTEDAQFRYKIASLRIDPAAPEPDPLPAKTLDLTGYHLTFDEPFTELSISDAQHNDGSRWYAKNEECCMSTTDGTATAMLGVSSPKNPFSLLPGGGLNIRLRRVGRSWSSGVITSVDSVGQGFSQQYGYFEMKAKFPRGLDTWPAFWLLNTAAKKGPVPAGEIDIVEYIANPHFADYMATTLHDWSNHTAPAASHYRVPLPTNGFHTYGMLWTADTMTFYFDSAVTMRCPTPAIMKQPYYLLLDLGIGSGWPTEKTPYTNDMQVQYVRAYAR